MSEASVSLETTGVTSTIPNTETIDVIEAIKTIESTKATKRIKRERPAGSTDKKKQHFQLSALAFKNEIKLIYQTKKKNMGKKWLREGRLKEIILEVRTRNNILTDVVIKELCI